MSLGAVTLVEFFYSLQLWLIISCSMTEMRIDLLGSSKLNYVASVRLLTALSVFHLLPTFFQFCS